MTSIKTHLHTIFTQTFCSIRCENAASVKTCENMFSSLVLRREFLYNRCEDMSLMLCQSFVNNVRKQYETCWKFIHFPTKGGLRYIWISFYTQINAYSLLYMQCGHWFEIKYQHKKWFHVILWTRFWLT